MPYTGVHPTCHTVPIPVAKCQLKPMALNSTPAAANNQSATEVAAIAPCPSQRLDFSGPVLQSYEQLRAAGVAPKWGSALTDALRRRNVFIGELRQVRRREAAKWAPHPSSSLH